MNELKVKAYDIIATIEAHQIEIEKLKQALLQVNKEMAEEAKKLEVKEG